MAAESSQSGAKQDEESNGTTTLQHIELDFNSSEAKQVDLKNMEEEKEAKSAEIEERKGSPLRGRGLKLGYVAPILKQGKPTAQLQCEELRMEAEKWKFAVILYVIGDLPTLTFLKTYLRNQCGIEGDPEIYFHNEGYYVVKCSDQTEKEMMLFDGPYMMGSRPIIIKEWMMDFSLEKEVLKEIPLWIRLPNLPFSCWSGDSLSRVGSVLGKPVCADECTSTQPRISYARLLIEVDITKPLQYKINIEGGDGIEFQQQVYYEWAPMYCHKCLKVGHVCREKVEKPQPPKQQWVQKGKEKLIHEAVEGENWSSPKNPILASIQVGHLSIPTENGFKELNELGFTEEGRDLIPNVGE